MARVDLGAGLKVARHRLANGLELLVAPDPSSHVISYQTWMRVGSRHEQPGSTGIAHLFEHLMFNETEHLPHGEFDRRLEAVGGRTNAATWVDWTFYEDDVPEGELPLVVELEAERLAHLVLQEPQVASEKDVVLNERRYRVDDQIEGLLSEELYRRAFTVHPYHHPTIGWEEDIRSLDVDKCRAFYRTFYAPNNAVLVVVGAVEEDDVVRRVVRAYGEIPPQEIPEVPAPPEPEQTEERHHTLHRPINAARVLLGYRSPPLGTRAYAAMELVDFLLYGGRSSRLFQRLIYDLEVCTEVRSHLAPFRDGGLYEVALALRDGVAPDTVVEEIDRATRQLAKSGPEPAELARARTSLLTDLARQLVSTHGRAELLGAHETTLGDFTRIAERIAHLETLTADEVTVAAATLVPSRRTRVQALPEVSA